MSRRSGWAAAAVWGALAAAALAGTLGCAGAGAGPEVRTGVGTGQEGGGGAGEDSAGPVPQNEASGSRAEGTPPGSPARDLDERELAGGIEANPFPLVLALPEAARWTVIAEGRWFVAEHAPTRSSVAVRVWPARATVSWQECWAELGRGHPELRAARGTERLLAEDVPPPLGAPPGFFGHLEVFLSPPESAATQPRGIAAHVGAGPRRCYAVVFRAEAPPGDAHGAELAARLERATERILRRLRWRGLEERHRPARAAAFGSSR